MNPQKETTMELLTKEIKSRLLDNGRKQDPVRGTRDEIDFCPVVKLFTPDAGCTWLLTEIDPEDPDIAFGLCDLGVGFPELGSVSLSEIASLRGSLGLPVEPRTPRPRSARQAYDKCRPAYPGHLPSSRIALVARRELRRLSN
jgi:hypothetical protein